MTGKRDLAVRIATSLLFLVVLALYIDRPERGTTIGLVGSGVIAAALWWRPGQRLHPAQLVLVIFVLPVTMLVQQAHESTAEQLVASVIFDVHGGIAVMGLCSALIAGILSLTLIATAARALPR